VATRLNKLHSELVLKRIKTSQLVNRLQDNALGLLKLKDGTPYQLTRGQVQSACFLIERTLAKAEKPLQIDPNANELKLTISFLDP
jgi:hypothetical protein